MLNLVKLCVGISSIEELQTRVYSHIKWRETGEEARIRQKSFVSHVTRMTPKRVESLLSGGSVYWVIKGNIQARQAFFDINPFHDSEGIRRCDLMLEASVVPTVWQARKAFQGWRYLEQRDAPEDLTDHGDEYMDMPLPLRLELTKLGLL